MERGQPNVVEPLWFRIGQIRLLSNPTTALVQRQILINSFAFTLLIAPLDAAPPCEEFEQFANALSGVHPESKPVPREGARITVSTGRDHTAASIYPTFYHYQSRFSDDANPYVVQMLRGEFEVVFLRIPRVLIEEGSTEPIANALRETVSTRDKATAFRQRIGVWVEGFDQDERALWQIPEARQFFRRLYAECPFAMWVARPHSGLLELLLACWLYEDDVTLEAEEERTAEFLNLGFYGLNTVTYHLAFSEKVNRQVGQTAVRSLFDEPGAFQA